MILHIGVGDTKKKEEGHLNIDIRPLKNIDVVADARKLPFKKGEHDAIVSRNLIEHIERKDIEKMFKEWARVLKKGGELVAETVDAGALMSRWYMTPVENLLDGMLGAQTYPENFHKMLFTQPILMEKLTEAGFGDIWFETFMHREIPRMVVHAKKL